MLLDYSEVLYSTLRVLLHTYTDTRCARSHPFASSSPPIAAFCSFTTLCCSSLRSQSLRSQRSAMELPVPRGGAAGLAREARAAAKGKANAANRGADMSREAVLARQDEAASPSTAAGSSTAAGRSTAGLTRRQVRAEGRAAAAAKSVGFDDSPAGLRALEAAIEAKMNAMQVISVGRARRQYDAVLELKSFVTEHHDEEDFLRYFSKNGPELPQKWWLGFANYRAATGVGPTPRAQAQDEDDADYHAAVEVQYPPMEVSTLTEIVKNAWDGMERLTGVKHADKEVSHMLATSGQD